MGLSKIRARWGKRKPASSRLPLLSEWVEELAKSRSLPAVGALALLEVEQHAGSSLLEALMHTDERDVLKRPEFTFFTTVAEGVAELRAAGALTADTVPFVPIAKGDIGGQRVWRAAASGDVAAARALLGAKERVDWREACVLWREPLHVAAQWGHAEIITLLVSAGAQVDTNAAFALTPLHLAAMGGHVAAVRTLLRLGADGDARLGAQRTAAHLAASRGHADVLRALHDGGAAVDAADARGYTPAHEAAAHHGAECLSVLCELGADIECEDSCQQRPLHLAITSGDTLSVSMLCAMGVDTNAPNGMGRTPLALALLGYSEGVLCDLIAHGARSDVRVAAHVGTLRAHNAPREVLTAGPRFHTDLWDAADFDVYEMRSALTTAASRRHQRYALVRGLEGQRHA